MTIYIALLRGINVGGKNKIKMADLRNSLEKMGLNRVQTYIQSGNILFESTEKEAELRKRIEDKILDDFKLEIPVILRTVIEVEKIVDNCPFTKEEIVEAEASSVGESLYVALLSEIPIQEKVDILKVYKTENEEFQIEGKNMYLLFRQSIRNSKLANQLHKLEVPATVRNWKTITKLVMLAKAMNS